MVDNRRMDAFLQLSQIALATRTWNDAYGHALVATGRVEAMLDPQVSLWDVSAMALIVREAGGQFTNFRGEDALIPRPDGSYEAISSNGLVLPEILAAYA
jgi:fructose-1,6-bisphosphatase/inositol monophosphatase family enzyme